MMGKKIAQSSKGRIITKSHEGGKPSSPGMSAYTKPTKMQTPASNRFREFPPFPYIKVQDNAQALPKYSSILARSPEEGIGMDELDQLQAELESLLCSLAMRSRTFQNEIENIDVNESKREKKGKAAGKQLQYPGKRKYPDEKPIKPKDGSKPSSTSQPKIAKFKNFTPIITPVPSQGSFSHDNILTSDNTVKLEMPSFSSLPKNNTPYKFWTSIEPYCGPITAEDIKFVESLLAQSANMPPPTIPPLGKHYSEVWADEHLSDDQLSSNPYKHKSSGASSDAPLMRKKGEKTVDCGVSGPLTQRLVSALLDDPSVKMESPESKIKQSNKSLSVRNSIALERCLRKELIEQGLLDPEDLPPQTNPNDDEILADIRKCLSELAVIKKTNVKNLRHLLSLCKQEMVRNNLKKQLEQVDAECTEIYKKHLLAKQKKRPLTKKEKEDAWRAINEQIRLNNEINALPLTGPNSG